MRRTAIGRSGVVNAMRTKLLVALLPVLLLVSCSAEKPSWPEATNVMKPWTRWWWMGNAVDRANIQRELKELAAAGIGGVEITSIYGVKGEEARDIKYQSPEFSEVLTYAIAEAHSLGMGVDLPPGAGWACGGPFVPEDKGLWALRLHTVELKANETWKPGALINAAAASFVAQGEDGEGTVVKPGEPFVAPSAGKLYVAERVKTGDQVKNPSSGGDGLVIDTYNRDTTDWYLQNFWTRMRLDEGLVRSFFHDSFEYRGDFTPLFLQEFEKRRGYDLAKHLHVLAGGSPDEDRTARVRTDYRETLSELVLGSFIEPMMAWAHGHQSLFRNQAHGSPGNILDIYAASDIPETEIFGTITPNSAAVFVNKFASSAAHVTGKKLVSSESFTWLDEHWTVTPADMVRATNRFFLAGVNHMIFHGTSYSPEDAAWPGWVFYASTQVNNRNPLWRDLPALFTYIERSQSILQRAATQHDLLVYWPFYDVAATPFRAANYTNIDRGDGAPFFQGFPVAGLSERLMNAGYTFDYVSDKQLLGSRVAGGDIVAPSGTRYRALVVPTTRFMPLETLRQMNAFVDAGGKVFFDGSLPESVPGMFDLANRQRALGELKQSVSSGRPAGDAIELLAASKVPFERSLSEKGFHAVRMASDGEPWYMVFNLGRDLVDQWVELGSPASTYLLYDPMSGEITEPSRKGSAVRLQLGPEQMIFIRCSSRRAAAPRFAYADPAAEAVDVKGEWKIRFTEGGPVRPADVVTRDLASWTSIGDEEAKRFAGTARYTIEFDWTGKPGAAVLDLGAVKDSARVTLNGKACGPLPGPVFKTRVDNLVAGKNVLEVEVTNVAANRIRDYDVRGVPWKKFHRRGSDFVNIKYQPFDASGWAVRDAGLLGPVTLHASR